MPIPTVSRTRVRSRVLLVEDDPETSALFDDRLTQAGFQVTVAADGNAAIEKALELRPHVIVVDLGLPVLDGTETIAVLRSYPTTRTTPIVVCTGRPDLLKKRPPYDVLLAKPCTPDELERAVREALGEDSDSGTG